MLRSFLDGLYRFAGYLAGLFLIVIFLLMMGLSIGRGVGINIPAGDDFASWCMAAMAFLGLAHTFRSGEMIRVGLLLDLGDRSRVSRVTLDAPGTGGEVELRTADDPGYDGSVLTATAPIETGSVTLTPTRPVTTRYLLVWFTRVPRNEGDNRIYVTEIDVR